jgi:hypothetical protein
MLYWICPECGGECSPAIRECPACAGIPEISPASAGPAYRKPVATEDVLSLVRNLQAPGPGYGLTNRSAGDNGHSALIATLELPEMAAEEAPAVPPAEAIESLIRPLVESTTVEPIGPASPPKPALEPLAPALLSDAMALQAEQVLESMAQQNIAQQDIAQQSAIRGIVASFQRKPAVSLLSPASEVVSAPAPVYIQWMRIPKPSILPVPPKDLNHKDLLSGLQTPPLAGPCVPQELRSLTERRGPASGQARKKTSLPAWTVSFIIAVTLFLAVGSLLQYLGGNRDAKAAAATAPPQDQSASAIQTGEHAASKLVEVTGLRIATGANHRPQLEFIVVNHSATPLSDIGLQIAVRSASANAGNAGVAPLFRVSTTVASLGAYQSREFRAELAPEVHATDVPDWQSLRADVRITQ